MAAVYPARRAVITLSAAEFANRFSPDGDHTSPIDQALKTVVT